MKESLSSEQAYLAMFAFLESHVQRGASDELLALLGSLSLAADGAPADPAVASDWNRAVQAAVAGKVNAHIRLSR